MALNGLIGAGVPQDMTALGEHGGVTPDVARKIYQMAV